jgi:subtilisin-like proprotein convertase family protein
MQYRSGAGKVFELESAGRLLDVHVTPRKESESDGEWRVTAQDRRGGDATIISEWGATRGEALEKVSRAWVEQMSVRNLSPFDWVAVTKTLQAIRAI